MLPALFILLLPLTAAIRSHPRHHHRPIARDSQVKILQRGCKSKASLTADKAGVSSPSSSNLLSTTTSNAVIAVHTPQSGNDEDDNQTLAFKAAAAISGGSSFNYGKDKIRGVNLGGWLVLESFITPSIFSATGNDGIVDEWTFCQYQDRSTVESALRNHWDSFITEDDFRQMSNLGINHVRIPMGYWAWDVQGDEPFIQGSADYLEKAVGWGRTHNLKILIDLHGVPGSQNGYDHSGRKGDAGWYKDPALVKRSVDIVRSISTRYGTPQYSDVVTMIELLNEPTLFMNDDIKAVTKQYYLDAYEAARRPWGASAGKKTDWIVVFHDGFQPMSWWSDYMVGDGYEKIWIDDHYYQAFDQKYFEISAEQHIRNVCQARNNYQTSPFPSIAGEWSIAVWACNPAERNTGMGNVGTCNLSENNAMVDYATFLRAYFDTQVQMFENLGQGQGWFYFNWKTESLVEWSYQKAVETGWIPNSMGQYQFNLDTVCSAA